MQQPLRVRVVGLALSLSMFAGIYAVYKIYSIKWGNPHESLRWLITLVVLTIVTSVLSVVFRYYRVVYGSPKTPQEVEAETLGVLKDRSRS